MKKIWAIFLSTLSVALAVAIGVGSSGFTNWNVKAWFNGWGKGAQPDPAPELSQPVDLGLLGEGMIIPAESGTEEDDVQFLSALLPRSAYAANAVSENAEKAYNVTATVLPDNEADNTAVEWSMSWKRTTDCWAYTATGLREISDYVTLVTNDESVESSKTVSVSCVQSFGEPIILTAKCKYAPEISDSIQIDYAARFNLMMGYFSATGSPNQDMEGGNPRISFTGDSEITFEFGDVGKYHSIFPSSIMYTIDGDYTISDNYNFTLSLERNDHELYGEINICDYHFDTLSHVQDLGSYTIERSESGSPYNSIQLPFTGGQGAKFSMTVNGIGSILTHGGSHGYTSTLKNDIDKGEYTRKEASDSLKSFLDMTAGKKIPLCTMILSVTGSRSSYTYSSNVFITKVLYSTNISGVEINGGNIVT